MSLVRACRKFSSLKVKDSLRAVEKDFVEGAEIEGFLVNKVARISEFDLTMVRLRHVHTGCDYLHLARDDDNNAFAVCFRTTPLVSTGVSHVLEHTALCGSVKYPCKDPFLRMSGRSMATFMNAMTGPDYTLFPFATQNPSDYKNLMSVYLDAVFRPQLRETDFMREGWRLEHETLSNRESPLVIKGVVYNEMKGHFSDNAAVFSTALLNNILPSHTYGIVSGGHPKLIPNLTLDDVKAFHHKYYHPSNCRIYSYGNFPLLDSLALINKDYLSEFPDTSDYAQSTKVPPEPRWELEKRKQISCRSDPLTNSSRKQSTIAIASLCNDIRASQETFTMQIISEMLINGNNAAFYQSLLEPNLGSGYAPMTGFDSTTRDCVFSIGLTGVDSRDFDKIIDTYNKTIAKVIDDGFDERTINAVLHTIELVTRHQSASFGLDTLFLITPSWNHDGDLTKAIKISDKVFKFKKTLTENPLYLQDMVQEVLKNNNHRLILMMTPDKGLAVREDEDEKDLLAQRVSAMSPIERDSLHEKCIEIAREIESRSDPVCLPCLSSSELSRDVERVHLKGFTVEKVPIQVCNVSSNGLTYLRGILNAAILSEDAKSLLPLFCTAATRIGTTRNDYRKLEQLIQLKTGRLSFATHVAENIYDMFSFEEGITFSSMCMDRNVSSMMELWAEIFTSVDFEDMERFRSIVKETADGVFRDLTESGDLYAISAAAAEISPSAERKEQMGGLQFIKKMKSLSGTMNLIDALETMAGIRQVILNKRLIRIAINTSASSEEKSLKAVDAFLKAAPGEFKNSYEITKTAKLISPVNVSMYYDMALPVSYTAHCFRTVEYTHDDFPILRLAARLLTCKYLFPNVREKIGAYGCSANISTSGVLSLSSYRDPRPAETFDRFKKAKSWLTSGEYSARDVDEAKLGVFQSLDAPVPSGSKGARNFLFGISDDELQRHREAILLAKKDDLVRVARLIDDNFQARCFIGSDTDVICRSDEHWQQRFVS